MADKDYSKLILGHIGIGFCISLFPFIAKIYALLIIVFGLFWVVKKKNMNNEVLYACAYLTGCEVFLRATEGNAFHEYGRYFTLLFIALGIFYKGVPKKWNPYFFFLLLLIPSVLITLQGVHDDLRRKIFFDVLGPATLGFAAIYTYKRKITRHEINQILLGIGLPIISYCTFLFLKYPLGKTVINNTESNPFLSGNFAPNQVATALGLGMFVFFLRLFLTSTSHRIFFINMLVFSFLYYRGLLTFSRGGMITGVVLIVILMIYALVHYQDYPSFALRFGLVAVVLPVVFFFASWQTDHLLLKRYLNQNPSGLSKKTEVRGRHDIAMEEIQLFEENPIMGIGVGQTKEIRQSKYHTSISSHNEITRMLAEHGILGVVSLFILILTPFLLFLKDRRNIYLICFSAFWLLTINHSAMRVAAPSLLYALALLSIHKEDFSSI